MVDHQTLLVSAQEAHRERISCLTTCQAFHDPPTAFRYLMMCLPTHPALWKIRLWAFDVAIHESVSKTVAYHTIRQMLDLCHEIAVTPGRVTVEWCLRTVTVSERMTCWLWCVACRDQHMRFQPPAGFPYCLLYSMRGESDSSNTLSMVGSASQSE